MRANRERGLTLIELVISIVIVGIAASTVLGVLSSTAARSADAMVLAQAVSIAEAYLEEITLKPVGDPDGVPGEANRNAFDDIDDYNGLVNAGARDQFDNEIEGLGAYRVSVTTAESGVLTGVPVADARRVDVRVQFAASIDLTLSGYKARL